MAAVLFVLGLWLAACTAVLAVGVARCLVRARSRREKAPSS